MATESDRQTRLAGMVRRYWTEAVIRPPIPSTREAITSLLESMVLSTSPRAMAHMEKAAGALLGALVIEHAERLLDEQEGERKIERAVEAMSGTAVPIHGSRPFDPIDPDDAA